MYNAEVIQTLPAMFKWEYRIAKNIKAYASIITPAQYSTLLLLKYSFTECFDIRLHYPVAAFEQI